MQGGIGASDWLTIIGMVVSVALATVVQSFVFWRWLSNQFATRDAYVQDQIAERTRQFTGIRAELHLAREQARNDVARVDKDITALNREVSIRLAQIPTRDVMEAILTARVSPLESDLRAMVIELARHGFDTTKRINR